MIPFGGSVVVLYTMSHSIRCHCPSVTLIRFTFGTSHTSLEVENSGNALSSNGPVGGPYIAMNMFPCASVRTYWILLPLLTCPCQGLLGFHHSPTYSWRTPPSR